jgi:hypothetical protein
VTIGNGARASEFVAKRGIGKCVAQCECIAESSDDMMFLNKGVDTSFASYLLQDAEIIFIDVASGTFF